MLYSCAWSQHAQSKASGSPAKHSYCHPVNQHRDTCAVLVCLESARTKQSLRQPCKTQLLSPSEPPLGFLCTTQALESSAGESSSGRTNHLQEGHPSRCHGEKSRNFGSSTTTSKQDKDSWHLLPQFTPGTHWYYIWVGCFPS